MVCDEPPDLENGHHNDPNLIFDSVIMYDCNGGYKKSWSEDVVIKCEVDSENETRGTWSSDIQTIECTGNKYVPS